MNTIFQKRKGRPLGQALHAMVANSLRTEISSGALQHGQQIASESALCKRFGVSRVTARQALSELSREGLVETVAGKGRFVSEHVQTLALWASTLRIRVVVDNTEDLVHQPWFLEAIDELSRATTRIETRCRLSYEFHTFTGEHDPVGAELLSAGECHGVLVIPLSLECRSFLATDRATSAPVVSFFLRLNTDRFSQFYVDQEAGAWRATEYLTRYGHRRIGLVSIAPTWATLTSKDREEGYRRALAAAGLTVDPQLIVRPPVHAANVRNACQDLLQRDDPPTALLIGGASLLKPALQALGESALRTPEQISVIAFDDIIEAQLYEPPLTVVKQPLRQGIRRALAQLLHEIQQPGCRPVKVGLEPELVVRGSCAAYVA